MKLLILKAGIAKSIMAKMMAIILITLIGTKIILIRAEKLQDEELNMRAQMRA